MFNDIIIYSCIFYYFAKDISTDALEYFCLFAVETQLHKAVSVSPHCDTLGVKFQKLTQLLVPHVLSQIQACF